METASVLLTCLFRSEETFCTNTEVFVKPSRSCISTFADSEQRFLRLLPEQFRARAIAFYFMEISLKSSNVIRLFDTLEINWRCDIIFLG